ncbi:MAG: Maf family protein [bacterium]|nr:Maf family protein [bacterium]
MQNKRIILASTSPRRKELLAKTGLLFEVLPGSYEEDMSLPMSPTELAKYLSKGKAEAVATENPEAVVIGADTFLSFEGQVLGKPHTKERAKEMLNMLNGKQHSVITGVTVIEKASDKIISETFESKVTFKNLTDEEIDRYIATGEPLNRAGAYAIQGGGDKFIEKIEGDYDLIVGLPVLEVVKILKDFDIHVE